MLRFVALSFLLLFVCALPSVALPPEWEASRFFGERVREEHTTSGVRLLWNAPANFDPSAATSTRLVIFATPNGNTGEQTGGAIVPSGGDWHYGIQHLLAQTRWWRQHCSNENIVLLIVQPDEKSWPLWRKKQGDSSTAQVRHLVETARAQMGDKTPVTLTGHSGGGSFLFAFVESGDIPPWVERIAFLDANYNFAAQTHGKRLTDWLRANRTHRLLVLAYDDRNITLDGKPVVGPTGGTWRATERMDTFFAESGVALTRTTNGDFVGTAALNNRLLLLRHTNGENKILHTVLVERNGFLWAMTTGGVVPDAPALPFGPHLYDAFIQPSEEMPARPTNAPPGSAFMDNLQKLPPAEQEAVLVRELTGGNVPPFLRTWKRVVLKSKDASGVEHTAEIEVMPDYLAIGSDTDFVRVPLTPFSAQTVADAWGCVLPTRKIVDAIYAQADVKLAPLPLTENREAVATFKQHHDLIEAQRAGRPLGLLVAGIKKDIVTTPRLREKPHRVAIYGWHKLDGLPIQPLTIVHRDTYRDYSHGVRLVKKRVLIDGQPRSFNAVLADPKWAFVLSDEGAFTVDPYAPPLPPVPVPVAKTVQ